jgi:hypothetical protein
MLILIKLNLCNYREKDASVNSEFDFIYQDIYNLRIKFTDILRLDDIDARYLSKATKVLDWNEKFKGALDLRILLLKNLYCIIPKPETISQVRLTRLFEF